jgi:O-acetylhomoserine/O-acetylserine sulfhydrylase-like pyridoxal-dependent enzyme
VTQPFLATLAVHAGTAPDPATGARAVPIYQSNGFAFDDLAHGSDIFGLERAGYAYGRSSNPTVAALERRIAALEGGTAALCTASGQAALQTILLTLCRSGDTYIAAPHVFGGTIGLMKRFGERLDIRPVFVDPHDLAAVERAITATTRAIFVESMINPSGDVVDLRALAHIAERARVPLVVDNTLPTPALLRPFEHGADIVWHSASKFMCGHGTAIGGAIVDSGRCHWIDERFGLIAEPFADYDHVRVLDRYPNWPFLAAARLVGMRELGPCLSPTTAFLILTGLETLPLRMARHSENAATVATALAGHPAVAAVSSPCLSGHPRAALAASLLPDGMGSIFTVTLKGGRPAAEQALTRFRIVSHLVNIGEARTLVAHPATTTHRNVSPETRQALGISEGTLRLSIGLEDADDLLRDFNQAFAG